MKSPNNQIQGSLIHSGNINPMIDGLIRLRSGGPSISLAASGGICSPDDVKRSVIAGADVAMVTSEIYRAGPEAIEGMLSGLRNFLSLHHFNTVTRIHTIETGTYPQSSQITFEIDDSIATIQLGMRLKAYRDRLAQIPIGTVRFVAHKKVSDPESRILGKGLTRTTRRREWPEF